MFTLLVVGLLARRLLRWRWAHALGAGLAAAALNFGLMVLDARWPLYGENIEALIQDRWGARGPLLALGAGAAALGLAPLAELCRKGPAA